jgi:hypothetical protein
VLFGAGGYRFGVEPFDPEYHRQQLEKARASLRASENPSVAYHRLGSNINLSRAHSLARWIANPPASLGSDEGAGRILEIHRNQHDWCLAWSRAELETAIALELRQILTGPGPKQAVDALVVPGQAHSQELDA